MNIEIKNRKVDIDERSFQFGVRVIKMAAVLPKNAAGQVILKQIVRSGTSIGANIAEAQGAVSKKEFIYCMNIAKREAKETLYWLRIIAETEMIKKVQLVSLIDECNQLVSILITILKKSQIKE